jgi:hypothetical protein
MSDNQFIVDLGGINLTDEQKHRMNAAIQKAVAGELAHFDGSYNLALFPIGGRKGKIPFPIIWGIIARPVKEQWIKDLNQTH